MAVPKSRHTKSKKNRRRAHIFLKSPGLTNCSKCGKTILSHTLCKYCGYYGNREVVDVLEKLETKEKKKREKEIKEKEKQETVQEKPLSFKELSKK
ncbi:MAG: 50S ribosomal protein L32 [Candidatus Pacebacteria bacterium]|nr:50S ribosomal protein L32 [Candidatus Paceibacterota bacterium]